MRATPWETVESFDNDTTTIETMSMRTISYSHPIKAPVGPPSAKAMKEQTLRRFGNAGLRLETRTTVKGVPVADCFHVDDCILVEMNQDSITIARAKFNVQFVKKTMLKKIVKSTTTAEVKQFFAEYQKFLTAATASKPEASPFDAFLCGMEETFHDLEETLGNPFVALLEKGMVNLEESLTNPFGAVVDEREQDVLPKAKRQRQEEPPVDTEESVELVYLAGLARDMRTNKTSGMTTTKQVETAMRDHCLLAKRNESELLREGIYAQWMEHGNDQQLLGYSVLDQAVVAALTLEQGGFGQEGAMEVVAF